MENESNKIDKSQKYTKWWIEWRAVIKNGFLATLFTTLFGFMVHNYNYVQSQYTELGHTADNMVGIYESLYNFCKIAVKYPEHPSEFQQSNILNIESQLTEKINAYNMIRKNLGGLASLKTHEDTHTLSCSIDYIVSANINACSAQLKSTTKIEALRDEVVTQINTDKKHHQTFYMIIGDFLLNYISNPRENKYKTIKCDSYLDSSISQQH